MAMKLSREVDGARTRVVVRGALEGGSCECLRHFFEAHCFGNPPPAEIVVDLTRVDHVDASGAAALSELVARSRANGTRVSVLGARVADHDAGFPPGS